MITNGAEIEIMKRAFALTELLVVIAIVAMLAALLLHNFRIQVDRQCRAHAREPAAFIPAHQASVNTSCGSFEPLSRNRLPRQIAVVDQGNDLGLARSLLHLIEGFHDRGQLAGRGLGRHTVL